MVSQRVGYDWVTKLNWRYGKIDPWGVISFACALLAVGFSLPRATALVFWILPPFKISTGFSKLTSGEALLHGWIPRTCSPSSMLAIAPLGALLSNSGGDKLHLLPWTSTCWLLMGFSKGDSWHSGWAHCLCSLLCSLPPALLPDEMDPDHSRCEQCFFSEKTI